MLAGSLEEERTGPCAFRAFVCFARIGLCVFPLPLVVRDWHSLDFSFYFFLKQVGTT